MRIKKHQIVKISLVILIFVLVFLYLNRKKEIPIEVPLEKNYYQEKTEPEKQIPNKIPIKKENTPVVDDFKKINVSMDVLGKKYQINVREGSSIFETMKLLEENGDKDNLFSFKYTDNRSMGSFVTEINEVKGRPSKYWIYYVNDKLASIGVSKYILKDGDIISWKNEGM